MDIHNTDGTNLLLANNEIVFYFTYKEFMDNYPNHLKKWLELQSPYGEEREFKEEYLEIYFDFYHNYFGKYQFEGINILREDIYGGSYEVFENISIYKDYLKKETLQLINAGKDPKKIFGKDYQKGITEEYTTDLGTHFFTYSTRQVLNMFFEWNDFHNRIIFKKNQYRNFTKNIEKIVTFLLSDELYTDNNPLSESNAPKKETLHFEPLPVSEPQQAEPTQEPQPVPKIGEAQPVPVVSEEPQPEDITPLQWNGTDIEFIELAKALEVSGVVTSEKHPFINIVRVLKKAFNFEIQNHYKKANDIKLRKIGGETLFLDKLQKELKDKWINKEK